MVFVITGTPHQNALCAINFSLHQENGFSQGRFGAGHFLAALAHAYQTTVFGGDVKPTVGSDHTVKDWR